MTYLVTANFLLRPKRTKYPTRKIYFNYLPVGRGLFLRFLVISQPLPAGLGNSLLLVAINITAGLHTSLHRTALAVYY